jgi:hypothetical protein
MIPLYGFLEGDTMGLLILTPPDATLAELADRLQESSSLRVAPLAAVRLLVRGQEMDPRLTVSAAGLGALDRFDVVRGRA